MDAYNVRLNGKMIDTVFHNGGTTAEDVKQSLINHDGYDPSITVAKVRKPNPVYIQRRGDGYLKTVDQFDTRNEARARLTEYRRGDRTAEFYLSQRACADWNSK